MREVCEVKVGRVGILDQGEWKERLYAASEGVGVKRVGDGVPRRNDGMILL